MQRTAIIEILYEVIDEMNQQFNFQAMLQKKESLELFGEGSLLDSLGLINFIVAVEEKFEDKSNVTLTLANEEMMFGENSPLRTVGFLADYIYSNLEG